MFLIIISFPERIYQTTSKIPRTNAEATLRHSDVPKLQLWNITELRESLTSRSAEIKIRAGHQMSIDIDSKQKQDDENMLF